jgi:hypothetical protein
MSEGGAVPCVQARASGAVVLVPLPQISCALPSSALKRNEGEGRTTASWQARELPVIVVAEALGLAGAIGPHSVVLVHERGSAALGLVVDSVGAVHWIATEQRLPLPDAARLTVASAVVQLERGLLWMIEPQRFWPGAGEVEA